MDVGVACHMDVGRAEPMGVGVVGHMNVGAANHMAGYRCVQHLKCTTRSLVMALQLLCRSHFDTNPSNNSPFDPCILLNISHLHKHL